MKGSIPIRMCVICKARKPKYELIRLVRNSEGKIVVDLSFKMLGRGAYICQECLDKPKWDKKVEKVFLKKFKTL